MLELLQKPWPWYVAGPLIGLTVPALLLVGNKALGISSSLRHVCAACVPAGIPFLTYNWRAEIWNLVFVLGIALGGFIGYRLMGHPDVIGISAATVRDLKAQMHLTDFTGLLPRELFAPGRQLPPTGHPDPDTATIPRTAAGRQICYGRELITRTAHYLGPRGSVAHLTNGLNCQNCHLQAGTQGFAINYLAVAATYPKLRARLGTVEGIKKRVANCMERSLNGRAGPDSSREMRAIVAYIQWLGQGIPKGKKVYGTGFIKLPYLDRAADPVIGKAVFAAKCQSCHGPAGQGQLLADNTGYQYPPLRSPDSYNDGAGLFRVGNLTRCVKATMPFGATFDHQQLVNEQA